MTKKDTEIMEDSSMGQNQGDTEVGGEETRTIVAEEQFHLENILTSTLLFNE